MPHPFFNTNAYPWRQKEAVALYDVLWQGYKVAQEIELFYAQSGGLDPLNLNVNPKLIWKEALEKLTRAGALKELCGRILADPNAGPPIQNAVLAVQNAPDVVDEVVLANEQIIFLDRKPLRDKLQVLASGAQTPVLLVRGASAIGKSWSRYMVIEVAKALGHPYIYLYPGFVGTVKEVVAVLFNKLNDESGPPPELETQYAWFQKVCLRLYTLGEKRGAPFWIVIDDLGSDKEGQRLDGEIREFFDHLVLYMGNPDFAEWFRLVLIDYPDAAIPPKWLQIWDEDRPDVTLVDAEALSTFVEQWAKRKNKKIDPNEANKFAMDVLTAVDTAMAVPNQPKSRLQNIHDEVKARLQKL